MSTLTNEQYLQQELFVISSKLTTHANQMIADFHHAVIGHKNRPQDLPSPMGQDFVNFLEKIAHNFQQISNWVENIIQLEQTVDDAFILHKVSQLVNDALFVSDYNADSLQALINGRHSEEFGYGFLFTEIEIPKFRYVLEDIYWPMYEAKLMISHIATEHSLQQEMELA